MLMQGKLIEKMKLFQDKDWLILFVAMKDLGYIKIHIYIINSKIDVPKINIEIGITT